MASTSPELSLAANEMTETHTLVEPRTFRDLAVSSRRMERADDVRDSCRGLRDLDTGEVFLVEERHLLRLPR